MTTAQHKNLIEKVIQYLRRKNDMKQEMKCSLDEIISTFTPEERKDYQFYTHPGFIKSFYESVKNNPKIHFEPMRKQFSFKNQFYSEKDFIEKLYTNKIGVLENKDLFDDLNQENIQKLKQHGLLREIYIKEKKTKDAVVILFSKNHTKCEVDGYKLEEKTSNFIKNYWNKIEKDALELKQESKYSNIKYLNKRLKIYKNRKTRSKRGKKKTDIRTWKNVHLLDKIEKALAEIEEFVQITHNKKAKKIKQLISNIMSIAIIYFLNQLYQFVHIKRIQLEIKLNLQDDQN